MVVISASTDLRNKTFYTCVNCVFDKFPRIFCVKVLKLAAPVCVPRKSLNPSMFPFFQSFINSVEKLYLELKSKSTAIIE